ncbi:MAG: ABC transporter substrate-binding protein, partial [Gammaproteobacteria bacterium]|nr:ABC transporter substrate-binding protein [Gammaproteobacteria bacterium]
DVRILEHRGTISPVDSLLAGDAHYAVTGADIAIHRALGKPVIALAAIFQHSPYAFLVKADSGIERIEDLAGKRIMLGDGIQDAALHAALRRVGIDRGDYTHQPTTFDVGSLLRDETDAFNAYTTDQGHTMSMAGQTPRYLLPAHYGVDFYGDILATTEQEAKEHPERLRSFRTASLRGWSYALDHPDELIDLILEKYNTQDLSREHLEYEMRSSRELIQPLLVRIGYMNPDRWRHIQEIFIELGIIGTDSRIDGLVYEEGDQQSRWIRWLEAHWFRLAFSAIIFFIVLALLLLVQMRRVIRRQTASLLESRERLGTLIDAEPACVKTLDRQGRLVSMNAAGLAMIDAESLDQVRGAEISELVDKPYRNAFLALSEKVFTGESGVLLFRATSLKGRKLWMETHVVPILDADGGVAQLLALTQDVTARVQREETLQTLIENMSGLTGQAYFDKVTTDLCHWFDADGALLGEIIPGNRVRAFSMELDGNRVSTYAYALEATPSEQIVACGPRIYPRNVTDHFPRDRGLRKLDIRGYAGSPIFDPEGEVIGIVGILSRRPIEIKANWDDMLRIVAAKTGAELRRIQYEEERERLQRELAQAHKMDALGQLTGGIAHDFNNILGVILGFTGLANARSKEAGLENISSYLDKVMRAGERASELVTQMLTFGRSSGIQPRPVLFRPLIEEDMKLLRASLPASIEILTRIEDDLPMVQMDPTQLHQLLLNLCINARDAMQGAGTITIGLRWARGLHDECRSCHKHIRGDRLELSVTDTGCGIEPQVLEKIFNPFFTTKEVGKGSGMGLAVVNSILLRHAGCVLVDTQPGMGTTFRTLFPPAETDARTTSEPSLAGDETPAPVQGGRVLVVDDEPDLAAYIGDLLELNGYRVATAINAQEALRCLGPEARDFDLLITDQTMPGMTGVELIHRARQLKPGLPAILCTGFSETMDEKTAERMDVQYLQKPVAARDLLLAVSRQLQQAA